MKNNLFIRQLGDYFDTFLPSVRKASDNTVTAYADSFAVFFAFMNNVKNINHTNITYKLFTPALFDEFILWMKNEKEYSATSIRQRLTAIRAFLKYASRRELSAISACSNAINAEKPKAVTSEFSYFTVDEIRILLDLPNPNKHLGGRDLVLLSVLYESGARAQELCDLRIVDVRFGNVTKIKLHGKGGKVREIAISKDVANLIRYRIQKQNLSGSEKRSSYLFSSQTNEKMTTACIRSITIKYVTMAKQLHPTLFLESNYSPHSFRHSKAVHMVEAGVPLIYIRNFLGHASVGTTEIYARIGNDAVTRALTNRNIPKLTNSAKTYELKENNLPDCTKRARTK